MLLSLKTLSTLRNLILLTIATVIVISSLILINNDGVYVIGKTQKLPISKTSFTKTKGYKLGYDLYLPNSFTGWTPNPNNKFNYDEVNQVYTLTNFSLGTKQVDDWGLRIKISSVDWENEFGFANANVTNEQSKFGISPNGEVLQLKFFARPSDSRDMFIEFPDSVTPTALNIKIKIISQDFSPKALMYIEYVSSKPSNISNILTSKGNN